MLDNATDPDGCARSCRYGRHPGRGHHHGPGIRRARSASGCVSVDPAAVGGRHAAQTGLADEEGADAVAQITALDPTRAMAILTFDQVPAALIGAEGQGGRLMSRVLDLACVALGAEQAGGARRCLEMSAGYARTRFQFGRAIGSFQAVKHKCADMLVRVELAEAMAREAAGWRMRPRRSSRSPPRRRTSAARRCTCSLRQYFRRAKSSELLFGDPAVYHERPLDRLSI